MLTGEAVSRVLLFQSFRHQDKLLLEIAPTKDILSGPLARFLLAYPVAQLTTNKMLVGIKNFRRAGYPIIRSILLF